jgi:hypothetical protein
MPTLAGFVDYYSLAVIHYKHETVVIDGHIYTVLIYTTGCKIYDVTKIFRTVFIGISCPYIQDSRLVPILSIMLSQHQILVEPQ